MRKKQVVYGFLALFTVWPIVHVALTRVYGLNPWKLAGWGMYSKPPLPNPTIELTGRGSADAPYTGVGMDGPLQAKAGEFLNRTYWLGELVEPGAVARAVFARYPRLQELRITVSRSEMIAASGMVEEVQRRYEYHR